MLGPSFAAGRSSVPIPPPPAYLKLPLGAITHAERSPINPFAGTRARRSGAQKAGLAYQKRIVEHLVGEFGRASVDAGAWFHYLDDSLRRSYCQPDVLVEFGPSCLVVEIKLRWTSDAWYQLRKLYLPVLTAALLPTTLIPLVICRSYDCAVPAGEAVNLIDTPADAKVGLFNVCPMRL